MEVLDRSYAKSVLLNLLDKGGSSNKSDLRTVASNWRTISDVVDELAKEELVSVKEEIVGRRVFVIELTERGRAVAEQLRRAQQVALGKKVKFRDKFAIISYINDAGPVTLSDISDEFPGSFESMRELMSLKLIEQKIDSSKYPPVNLIYLTDRGRNVAVLLMDIEAVVNGGKVGGIPSDLMDEVRQVVGKSDKWKDEWDFVISAIRNQLLEYKGKGD